MPSRLRDLRPRRRGRRAKLGSYFGCNEIDRLICQTDEGMELTFDVAADAPGNYGIGSLDAVLVLVNDPVWGGSGGAVMTASLRVDSASIVSHEFGHTVVDLGDEYEDEYPELVEYARTLVNVSGPVASPEGLKWFDLVHPLTPIPTTSNEPSCSRSTGCSPSTLPPGTAGMHEGAGYVACGSYGPTTWCIMRCSSTREFCPVCARAYRTAFGALPKPAVGVYMRDNLLDNGAEPSPSGVEYPSGSGSLVRPWHSVDIRVDAPPYRDAETNEHENPVAGLFNRVYVTVHNRGSQASPVNTDVSLYWAPATGGAPPFPGANWQLVNTMAGGVSGQGGSSTFTYLWNAPIDAPPHTCLIAVADRAQDPAPAPGSSLSGFVRNSNNVTWRNLHVVGIPLVEGEISNLDQEVRPIVFRIESADTPVGAQFNLSIDPSLDVQYYDPTDPRVMQLNFTVPGEYSYTRQNPEQTWISLRMDLPAADEKEPFRSPFSLKVFPPGGTPVGFVATITVEQYHVDPETQALGALMGGNTYVVTLE